jgi:thiol-disulfide isomerase/thioredoxin
MRPSCVVPVSSPIARPGRGRAGLAGVTWSFVAALTLFLAAPAPAKTPSKVDAPARHAPPFSLPTRTGTVTSDSLRGRVMLVDFWASWCGPCRQSFPWMSALHDRYGPKGLEIVAINLDKDRRAAESFLEKYPAPFAVAFDPSGNTAKAYKVWGMPSGFVIGKDGTILDSYIGFNPKESKKIETMIEEAMAR